MNSCNVDVEFNIFDNKDRILRHFSDDDLENEIERRNTFKIIVDETDLDIEFEVDLSDFEDEIMDNLAEDDLVEELENRDYVVYAYGEEPDEVICTKHGIAELVGLKWWSTKEQILKELENIL